MSDTSPQNSIIIYLLLTALMVVTFVCAIAISHDFHSEVAWLILLLTNVGIIVYLSTSKK